jgi:hypothetical protein
MDADQIKRSTSMFDNMSNEEIERNMNNAKAFMPGIKSRLE